VEEGVAEAEEIFNKAILGVLQEELALRKLEVSMVRSWAARTLAGDMEYKQHSGVTV
jgi:hypothetical protein